MKRIFILLLLKLIEIGSIILIPAGFGFICYLTISKKWFIYFSLPLTQTFWNCFGIGLFHLMLLFFVSFIVSVIMSIIKANWEKAGKLANRRINGK